MQASRPSQQRSLATLRTRAGRVLVGLLLGLAAVASGQALEISQKPLFIPRNFSPNLVVTLDDSGSMRWAFAPDSKGWNGYNIDSTLVNSRRFKSAAWNPLYYDPDITYLPGLNADGTARTTSFTAAKQNGFIDYGSSNTVNLSNDYRPVADYDPNGNVNTYARHPASSGFSDRDAGTQAYYYVFKSSLTNCDGTKNDDDCYEKVVVSTTSGPGGTDERQNFANWYSFYRTRNLMTITGASRSFAGMGENLRVAWQNLHTCKSFSSSSCKGWGGDAKDNRIRKFSGTHKDNFYYWLFRLPASGGTPLRTAMYRAGEYFKTSGLSSPYAEEPQVTLGTEYSCRPNFHILMTDGIWNSDSASDFGNPGNFDNTSHTLPDGTNYPPATATDKAPYADANSNSLADLSFKYWTTDLRTDLANNQLTYYTDRTGNATTQYWNPKNDPASWQHMVTFTVGLGLTHALTDPAWAGDTYSGGYTSLNDGTASWPSTGSNLAGNVYDLWHAALNSRGQFFSVETPQAMNQAFQNLINHIGERDSSAAALAANSTQLETGTVIYQAKFNSADWSGQLLAHPLNSDGSLGAVAWDAATRLPAHGDRNIYTWNGSQGVAFQWASLSAAQKTLIDSANKDNPSSPVLNYLRGDQSREVNNGGSYRNRSKRLGDIINSDPQYVAAPDFGYATLTESLGVPYQSFVNSNLSRRKMIYVGANDGMLHGFDASNGVEMLAYVPNAVIANLSAITATTYGHKYYVDAPPFVGDAFVNGGWKTVLLGATGAGGKAIFALDVTDPADFSASKVMWEFTDTDLGYTIGQPIIARMANGKWAAVFGNGYGSTNHRAVLYFVDIADGSLIRKIDLGANDPVTGTAYSNDYPNGLSTPSLYDHNGDKIIDTVYAGDLQGNLWKFDVSHASNPSEWGSAFKSGSDPKPLFTARNTSNQVQPITAPVEISAPPQEKKDAYNKVVMITFGTGKYFATDDEKADGPSGTYVTQSVYGILDTGTRITATNRGDLQQQTIIYQGADTGSGQRGASTSTVRATSNNAVNYASKRGWYMDLAYDDGNAGTDDRKGERVISIPLIRDDRVVFTSMIPSSNPCEFGGTGWLTELSATTGARLDYTAFDMNNDDTFDSKDYIALASGSVPISSIQSTVGITKSPAVVGAGTKEYKLSSGTTGNIAVLKEKAIGGGGGRVSWQEIIGD